MRHGCEKAMSYQQSLNLSNTDLLQGIAEKGLSSFSPRMNG
jgi:hypothetical protein